jgi:hypothetical protein
MGQVESKVIDLFAKLWNIARAEITAACPAPAGQSR